MKPAKIFDIMDLSLRARKLGEIFNPLFVGAPGVGKSHIVQSWAKSKNLPFIDLRIAYMESPDLIGFPSIETRDGRQITVHNLPEFLPHGGEGVLLLEEVNRGTSSVMNCLMQILTDRKIHKYSLPEGWLIVGCINPEGNEYDVAAMDPALKDRFEMFQVAYDKASFVSYIKEASWEKDLVNFIEAGLWNYKTPEEVSNVPGSKYVSPRTLSKLNAALRATFKAEDELMIFETVLGTNVAKDFFNFRHNDSPVMMHDLKTDLQGSLAKLAKFSDLKDYKNGLISLTVKNILDDNTISDELLMDVVLAIPVEQGTALLSELQFKRKDDTITPRLCKGNPKVKAKFKSVINFGK